MNNQEREAVVKSAQTKALNKQKTGKEIFESPGITQQAKKTGYDTYIEGIEIMCQLQAHYKNHQDKTIYYLLKEKIQAALT